MADTEHIAFQPLKRKAWSSDDYFIVGMSVAVGLSQACNWRKSPEGAKSAINLESRNPYFAL